MRFALNRWSRRDLSIAAGFLVVILALGGIAATGVLSSGTEDWSACNDSNQDHKSALDQCTRAIEAGRLSGAELARMYLNRGIAWQRKGDHDRAIVDYDAAIRLDSRVADTFHNRGNAWQSKGAYDRAIADYDVSIGLNPLAAVSFHNRGNARLRKGDHELAIADYNEAIRLVPQYASAFNNRGNAWHRMGEYARAVADYDIAVKLNPEYASAYANRGFIRYYQGSFELAAKDFQSANRWAPPDGYIAIWLQMSLSRAAGKPSDVLAESLGGLRNEWPFPIVRFLSGELSAEGLYLAATSADPETERRRRCEISFYTGEWDLILGKKEEAIEQLRAALSLCPSTFIEYQGAVAELARLIPNAGIK